MHKKLKLGLSITLVVALLLWISFSLLPYRSEVFERSKIEVPQRGDLQGIKSRAGSFKHNVCSDFPFLVPSEKPHEESWGKGICLITFKRKDLILYLNRPSIESVTSIFNGSFRSSGTFEEYFHISSKLSPENIFSSYEGKTFRELKQIILNAQQPKERFLLYRKDDFESVLLFLLKGSSLNWRTQRAERFKSRKFDILVQYTPSKSRPLEQVVDLFSNDMLLACSGDDCLDYFLQSGILR